MSLPRRRLPAWKLPVACWIALAMLVPACVQGADSPPKTTDAAETARPESEKPSGSAENHRYTTRKDHDPDGIGKFYMGREIARVMTFHGAEWLERAEREREEQLSTLIKSLKLKPGMIVADIGAGTGVVSVLMAPQVAPGGRVLAVDIQQEMLDLLDKKLKLRGIRNVDPVLGTIKSPGLKPATADLALLVDVYHEFDHPYEMTLAMAQALKPGGRLVFVEYRKEDPDVPIKLVHKMTEAQVKKEMAQPEFGLKWKETIGVLPRQHIIVFERMDAPQKKPQPDK